MRHAEAEPARGRRDHERPLSKAGLREAEAAGAALAAADLVPDLALVSDSLRTRLTFERACIGLGAEPPGRFRADLYGATPDRILAAVRELPANVRTALVIGHNPGIGDCARSLSTDGGADDLAALRAHFPTACRAVIRLDGESWSAVAPGRLERLIGAKRG